MQGSTALVPTTPLLLKKAASNVWGRESEFWDEERAKSLISRAVEQARWDGKIFDALKAINLAEILIGTPGLDEQFNCLFFRGRKAWIHQNKNGHFHYYSRKEGGSGVYRFDFLDLLSIFRHETPKAVFRFLEDTWQVPGITGWYLSQHEKHRDNEMRLVEFCRRPESHPALNQLCGRHWEVLSVLNDYALDNAAPTETAPSRDPVFFLSLQHLSKLVPNFSMTVLTQVVNLFVVLGFLDKLPMDVVPEKMAARAKRLKWERQKDSAISFYSLPRFSGRISDAERKAKTLIEAGIRYYRINRKTVETLFGREEADRVFLQKTYGRPRRNDPVYVTAYGKFYSERERLERMFLEEIQKTGKCEKRSLKESTTLPAYRFDAYWKELVKKHRCKETYPTDLDMKRYGMSRRRLIAVPDYCIIDGLLTIGNNLERKRNEGEESA